MNDRIDRLTEEARQLTDEERVELLDRLWDLIPIDSDALPVPEWHRDELDRRSAEYDENPKIAMSWEEVKARLLARSHS